jgi:hypothetical protein
MQSIRHELFIAGIVVGCLAIALLFSVGIFYFACLCHREEQIESNRLLLRKKRMSIISKLA